MNLPKHPTRWNVVVGPLSRSAAPHGRRFQGGRSVSPLNAPLCPQCNPGLRAGAYGIVGWGAAGVGHVFCSPIPAVAENAMPHAAAAAEVDRDRVTLPA